MTSQVPPLASILASAEALNAWALTVNFRVTSPVPRILMPSLAPVGQADAAQGGLIHPGAVLEAVEGFQVDGQVAGAVLGVVEAAFGDAANERHLAAFKANADGTAGTGGLAFAAAPAGLAVAAGFALAQTLAPMPRALPWFEIV